jgi:hypothetical protein
MKRMMAIVTLFSLLTNCTYSLKQYSVYKRGGIVTLDERVGESIDAEERQRFDLFPGIDNFKEARFYSINENDCEIIIWLLDDSNFRIICRDPLIVDILGDYINTYDEITFSKKKFERRWRIVGYDNFGLPITQFEVNHVKEKRFRYICGGIGFGICFSFCFIMLEINRIQGAQRVLWEMIAGLAGGIAGWRILGSKIDERNAIEAIKRSREPQFEQGEDSILYP